MNWMWQRLTNTHKHITLKTKLYKYTLLADWVLDPSYESMHKTYVHGFSTSNRIESRDFERNWFFLDLDNKESESEQTHCKKLQF
jgi:hypothetical protein